MKVLHSMKLAAVVFLAASLSVGTADAARREKAEEPKIDYPDATRESPKAENSPRLGKQIQKMFDLYNEGEDMEGAIKIAEEVLANDRAKPYDRGVALMIAGNAALGIDEYGRAMSYLERALEENALPNNNHYATMHTLASVYAQEDKIPEAVAMIDRMIAETKSKDPEVYGLKGGIHYNAGQYDQAIEAIKRAIELKTDGAPESNWLQMLMAAYNETGRDAEAVALAEQLQKQSPDDKRTLLNLASLYAQTDMTDKAAALLNDARNRGMLTEQKDYEVLYAIYLNMDGKEADAAKVIQEGLDKGILKADAKTYTFLAQSLYFSDQVDAAIAAYQKAAPLAADGETALALSQILTNEDRNQEAKVAAQQALSKGLKKPGEAWMVIARSEYYMDNFEAAKAAYREAAKDPATRDQAQKALAQISR